MNLGAPEIILIAVVILLLFGAKKLPELARSMGRAQKEFKAGIQEGGSEPEEERPASSTTTNASSSDGQGEQRTDQKTD